MSNHLIVGLGGTGGKVIRNIRKAIYRDGKPSTAVAGSDVTNSNIDKVEQATPPGIKLEYLYVDSSGEHMGVADPEWKVLGENVQLDKASHFLIEGSDLKSRLDDIGAYPAIAPWIGKTQDWDSILNLGSGGAKVLGGQRRRLGRLLFCKSCCFVQGASCLKGHSVEKRRANRLRYLPYRRRFGRWHRQWVLDR